MQVELDLKKRLEINDTCILWCTLDVFDNLDFSNLINKLRLEVLEDEEFERILRLVINYS